MVRKSDVQARRPLTRYAFTRSRRGCQQTGQCQPYYAHGLLAQGRAEVGQLWPHNFLVRQPRLKKQWSRVCDYQRASCEDTQAPSAWLTMAQILINKHGILESDVHIFDETGYRWALKATQRSEQALRGLPSQSMRSQLPQNG